MRRRGGTISVDLSLFVLLFYTNFLNTNLKSIIKKNYNNTLTVYIFFHLQNHPTFRSEERLVNLVGGAKYSSGTSFLGIAELYRNMLNFIIFIEVFTLQDSLWTGEGKTAVFHIRFRSKRIQKFKFG